METKVGGRASEGSAETKPGIHVSKGPVSFTGVEPERGLWINPVS